MSKKTLLGFCFALCSIAGIRAETIASGTTIPVRTNDAIDARDANDGRVFSGVVDRDVFDVTCPRGSYHTLLQLPILLQLPLLQLPL
jgi:hypothetical protein